MFPSVMCFCSACKPRIPSGFQDGLGLSILPVALSSGFGCLGNHETVSDVHV